MEIKKISFAIIACLIAGGVQAGERLAAAELTAFYTGKTINGVHFKHGPGRAYYSTDGAIHSKSDNGTERVGKWWIDESNDTRCVRWNNKNKDLCHYTERNDDGTHTLIHSKKGKELVVMKSSMDGNHLQ